MLLLPLMAGVWAAGRGDNGPGTITAACPAGFKPHAPGYWQNSIPGPPGHPQPPLDPKNNTPALCGAKCKTWHEPCVAFEVSGNCYIFIKSLVMPFTEYAPAITCVLSSVTPPAPPPPPPPPPQRGKTVGHTFPRLSNCWGDDPYITAAQWEYAGFPNITNDTWAEMDVLYLNPFDSCCWLKEMDDWVPRIKAIKSAKPDAVVLATFHATEIWAEDLVEANRWLPESCLMRNADGTVCSWWVGLVFSNNLFRPECWQAAVDNAIHALEGGLLDAGVDGVFLDGVIPYTLGCTHADVNCTSANCTATAQPNAAALETEWENLYAAWFAELKAKHSKLLWVNNLLDELEPALLPVSNGRMYEGTAAGGLDTVYSGSMSISQRVALSRKWADEGAQPNYVQLSMNSAISGGWRVGRWQNLVTRQS
eukprot:COSAG02_NODE_1718_length_11207_cov_2.888999_6_plen_422_part_00